MERRCPSWFKKEGLEGFDVTYRDLKRVTSIPPGSDSKVCSAIVGTNRGFIATEHWNCPILDIDISVGMPESIFSANDILNQVYFQEVDFVSCRNLCSPTIGNKFCQREDLFRGSVERRHSKANN